MTTVTRAMPLLFCFIMQFLYRPYVVSLQVLSILGLLCIEHRYLLLDLLSSYFN